ncbi:reverse transcriptase domain-containing protein [Tanacetum coccineum]
MSSPNHPTSDIEDAFSSNFPDYFPASPGNTSSESSNNSSGLVPIASPTLSLFHNDPYMKVMQAYDAISPPQVTIPPPTVVPPSPVLSLPPMFDSRDFFPPEEIPTPPKNTETPSQAATWQADNTNRKTRTKKVQLARKCSYNEFMSWQPINFKEEAYKITWVEFKKLLIKKYCPRTEVQKMEDKFYHLTMKGNDLKTYVRRFQELATLCPTMVLNIEKHMEAFIGGLPRSIEGNVYC